VPEESSVLQGPLPGITKRQESAWRGFRQVSRRLHANKAELLKVLERPEIPLHTNGSENDIRCHVTRRKVSGGTRSDRGLLAFAKILEAARATAPQMQPFPPKRSRWRRMWNGTN
jgi:hypothetical protein